jgi:hypothetical protein
MPAESSRLRRRIASRDRWFLVLAACAAVVATVLAVVLTGSGDPGGAGCVSVLRAGFMGGQTTTYCGAKAAAVCRKEGPRDADLARECRRRGFAVPARP